MWGHAKFEWGWIQDCAHKKRRMKVICAELGVWDVEHHVNRCWWRWYTPERLAMQGTVGEQKLQYIGYILSLEALRQTNLLPYWSETSSVQSQKKKHFCCLSLVLYGSLLPASQDISTLITNHFTLVVRTYFMPDHLIWYGLIFHFCIDFTILHFFYSDQCSINYSC